MILRGAYRDLGVDVWGALEDQGLGPFRQKGGYPVDHVGRDVGGQESASAKV